MAHCRKKQLSIFINNRCNLGCKYCYEGVNKLANRKSLSIDFDFVKKGIVDFFSAHTDGEIRFFANGEPTLDLNLIKKIKKFAVSINKDCRFELQTNGFFSKTVTQWIGKNMDIVWISCDGPAWIQNYYRPTASGSPSSNIVEENIRFLASSTITLGCRVTVGKRNVGEQFQIIDYFYKLGVKAVMSDPMFKSVNLSTSSFSQEEAPNLIYYAKLFLKANKYANSKGIFYGSILSVNFDEKTEYACRACIPCPHLTIDGYVSACDMASDITNKKMSALIYGRYDKKKKQIIYNDRAMKFIQSRKASNMAKCKKCKVLNNCAGACLGEALNETEDIFGIKPETCKAIRYLARRMPLNKGVYPYLHP